MQLINVQKLTKYKIEIMYALSYMQLYKKWPIGPRGMVQITNFRVQ